MSSSHDFGSIFSVVYVNWLKNCNNGPFLVLGDFRIKSIKVADLQLHTSLHVKGTTFLGFLMDLYSLRPSNQLMHNLTLGLITVNILLGTLSGASEIRFCLIRIRVWRSWGPLDLTWWVLTRRKIYSWIVDLWEAGSRRKKSFGTSLQTPTVVNVTTTSAASNSMFRLAVTDVTHIRVLFCWCDSEGFFFLQRCVNRKKKPRMSQYSRPYPALVLDWVSNSRPKVLFPFCIFSKRYCDKTRKRFLWHVVDKSICLFHTTQIQLLYNIRLMCIKHEVAIKKSIVISIIAKVLALNLDFDIEIAQIELRNIIQFNKAIRRLWFN